MKFVDKTLILNAAFNIEIGAGKFSAIQVLFEGTNNSGQTLAEADLGKFLVTYQGKQIQIGNADMYNTIARLKQGRVYSASAAGGAFVIPVIIPLSLWDENLNAVQCNQKSDLVLEWQGNSSTLTTKVASGNVTVNVKENPAGLHLYNLRINQQTMSGWASGLNSEPIQQDNIHSIFVSDDSDIDRFFIHIDNRLRYNESRNSSLVRTLLENKIEDTAYTLTYHDFPLSETNELSAVLSDTAKIEVNATGALTPELVIVSIDFTPEQLEVSKVSRQAFVNEKEVSKQVKQKAAPVKFLEAIRKTNVLEV